jgi:hypothetical protein
LKADIMFGWLRIVVEKRFGGHQESWRANAALERRPFQETLLQRMQMAVVGKPFDRLDAAPFRFNGKDQATIHRPAVEEHRAGAAVAVVATFLGAGERERIAQHFQQALPRLAEKLRLLAVDRGGDVFFLTHGEGSLPLDVE